MKLNVAIICGGRSTEHDVSLLSAKNIYDAIDRDKFEVSIIKIDEGGAWHALSSIDQLASPGRPQEIQTSDGRSRARGDRHNVLATASRPAFAERVDVVFPIVHGAFGEDGCLQGFLKMLDIPFVGADVLGSAVGMDKDVMKRLLQQGGVPTPRWLAIHRKHRAEASYENVVGLLGRSVFVKPANGGSSVGIAKATSEMEYIRAVEEAFLFDDKILVEEAVVARELECSVIGGEHPRASVLGEVIPTGGFYSYQAKYIDEKGAILAIPADIPQETAALIRETALKAYEILCCSGFARIDFFLTECGDVLVNEINTLPGFTSSSMYPRLWEATGVSYPSLVTQLIEGALQRHLAKKRLRYSYHHSQTANLGEDVNGNDPQVGLL